MMLDMMANWGNWVGSGMMGSWTWPFAFVGGTMMLIALAAGLFWLWMIVDCLQRSDRGFPSKGANDKLIWVLVLIFANFLGAILYYLLVKAKR